MSSYSPLTISKASVLDLFSTASPSSLLSSSKKEVDEGGLFVRVVDTAETNNNSSNSNSKADTLLREVSTSTTEESSTPRVESPTNFTIHSSSAEGNLSPNDQEDNDSSYYGEDAIEIDLGESYSFTMAAESQDRIKLDKYGFIRNLDARGHFLADSELIPEPVPTTKEAKRTERRERKWSNTLRAFDRYRRPKVLIRRLRKGVPDSLRGEVWTSLAGGVRKKGLYEELLKKTSDEALSKIGQKNNDGTNKGGAKAESPDRKKKKKKSKASTPEKDKDKKKKNRRSARRDKKLLKAPKDFVLTRSFRAISETIDRDIHRTYPRHNMFYEEERSEDNNMGQSSLPQTTPESIADSTEYFAGPEIADMLNGNANATSSADEAQSPMSATTVTSSVADTSMSEIPDGQAALRRVLRAYSYYDREVGYCQGMNFIAGMFLTLMSEEEAFWMLVYIMHEEPCKMRGLFGEGMRETHMVLHIAEQLVHMFLPKLAKHFDKENIHVTMYATQWLLTQYTSSFNFDLVTRVWDCFLGEGWKIIYRVMLALLSNYQSRLMKMGFEEILAFFRELPDMVEGGVIIDAALKIPLKTKHLTKLEEEWRTQNAERTSNNGN